MVTGLMIVVLGSVALVGMTYRLRRDLTGPDLTPLSEATWWVSFGALLVYVAAGWLSGSDDQWADSLAAALALAALEAGCLVTMTVDTVRERPHARRRDR